MTSHSTQHTVAIAQVRQILQGAQVRGLDVDGLLRRAGIAPALLASPLARVTQAQYAALMLVLRRRLRDEFWGLCSTPVRPGSFAQCARLALQCATLGEALRAACAFYHLLLADFAPRLGVSDGVASLRVTPRRPAQRTLPIAPGDPAAAARLSYAERSLCFLGYGLACWLVARRIPLQQVVYPASDQGQGTDAANLFQAPVEYAQDGTRLLFESRWLDLPVVQNRQSLGEFLRQAPTSLIVKYRDQSNVTERIRRLLRRALPGELPSLEEVSEALALSPQTLRRRLLAEGQGFQGLKDGLRRDLAIDLLAQAHLSLPEIANRLGFAEASTFHRAFKGWTGMAPGAYRQRL